VLWLAFAAQQFSLFKILKRNLIPMKPEELKNRNPEREFVFSTSRSSGPGGQNINKVDTKVELHFNIRLSLLFTSEEKILLFEKLKNRINKKGELIIRSSSERSQHLNRKKCIGKFYILINEALKLDPMRKITVPTKRSKEERLQKKRRHGTLKKTRMTPDDTLN
jgi:ribosome-associated protein